MQITAGYMPLPRSQSHDPWSYKEVWEINVCSGEKGNELWWTHSMNKNEQLKCFFSRGQAHFWRLCPQGSEKIVCRKSLLNPCVLEFIIVMWLLTNSFFSLGLFLDSMSTQMVGKIMWGMFFPERVAQPTHDIKERWEMVTLAFLKDEERRGIQCQKPGFEKFSKAHRILSLRSEDLRWHMPSLFWASWPNQTRFETTPLLDSQLSRQLGKYESIFEWLTMYAMLS